MGIRKPDIRIMEPFDYWTLTNPLLSHDLNTEQKVCYSSHDLNTALLVRYSSHDLNSRLKSVIQVMNRATYDLNNGLIVRYSGHGLNTRPFR